HAAYDNSVEKSASRYYNVANSIYSHGNNYINAAYCYPGNFAYHGGFFGNKSNGMNVSYASDPYWSEKAAGNYAKYDEVCGYKDLNAQTLGIVTEHKVVDVYLYPNNTQVLYSTNGEKDFAFILVDMFSNEYGNWYIIQADPIIQDESMVERGIYDFANNIAYIHEEDIGYILKGSNFSNVIKNITFDAGEGLFRDGSHIVTIPYKIGDTVTYESPFLAGHEFVGWNQEGDVYEALYKNVRSIKLINEPKSEYEINDRIYLKDLMLEVTYKDGYSKQIPVTTEMVSGYDFRETGEQEVKISYGGYALTYPITVSQELDDLRQENKTLITELLSDYENINSLTSSDKERIKTVHEQTKASVFPDITFVQLKNFDALVHSYDERNFVIEENDYDLGVSGLSLNVIEDSDLFFADQLKLTMGKDEVDDTIKKMITTYGYELVDCFSIHLFHNFKEVIGEEDLIFSIDLP
ncbi:MAG: bacterial Ig-like domain-containing protein, partial [Erysipelotrichaceae bacterium]|nr:bacterial Ig-like domain-containing protein [Erysipelotrichaceae bacterium]